MTIQICPECGRPFRSFQLRRRPNHDDPVEYLTPPWEVSEFLRSASPEPNSTDRHVGDPSSNPPSRKDDRDE